MTFGQADACLNGVTYVHFEHAFNNFVIPPRSTENSGTLDNVLLTQGAVGSLGLLGDGKVDITIAVTLKSVVAFST